jgi:hypothetical protein
LRVVDRTVPSAERVYLEGNRVVRKIEFSKDGKLMGAVVAKDSLQIWDMTRQTVVQTISTGSKVVSGSWWRKPVALISALQATSSSGGVKPLLGRRNVQAVPAVDFA